MKPKDAVDPMLHKVNFWESCLILPRVPSWGIEIPSLCFPIFLRHDLEIRVMENNELEFDSALECGYMLRVLSEPRVYNKWTARYIVMYMYQINFNACICIYIDKYIYVYNTVYSSYSHMYTFHSPGAGKISSSTLSSPSARGRASSGLQIDNLDEG